MDELSGGARAGETIADQRGEEVRDGKDLKLVDKVKQFTPTRMLRSKIALTLMTSSIAFLVMIILLTSGMITSSKENFENQDFCSTGVNGDVNRAQNQDFGPDTKTPTIFSSFQFDIPVNLTGFDTNENVENQDFRMMESSDWYSVSGLFESSYCSSPVSLGGFDTNEGLENQDFGRDTNRPDYFRVIPFDPLHGDDSNISGIANGGGMAHQVEISSNNGSGADEASTSGIVVSQTFNHESANTVGIPSITVQALEQKLAKYEEERERREQEFQSQLEAERKQRADMEARQQETAAQLAQKIALLEQISAIMRQYRNPPPPPPPPPPPQ